MRLPLTEGLLLCGFKERPSCDTLLNVRRADAIRRMLFECHMCAKLQQVSRISSSNFGLSHLTLRHGTKRSLVNLSDSIGVVHNRCDRAACVALAAHVLAEQREPLKLRAERLEIAGLIRNRERVCIECILDHVA